MDSDFVIPLNKEDLLSNRAADGYGVRKIYEPSKLGEKLEGILQLFWQYPIKLRSFKYNMFRAQ